LGKIGPTVFTPEHSDFLRDSEERNLCGEASLAEALDQRAIVSLESTAPVAEFFHTIKIWRAGV
jgi:hypothetical protein